MSDNKALPCPRQHPLDLLPLFRRWPPSLLRNLVYTGLWSSAIAVFLTAANRLFDARASWSDIWWPTLLISNLVGYLVHLSQLLLERVLGGWPRRARGWPRVLYQLAQISACVLLGIACGLALLRGANPLRYLSSGVALQMMLPFALFVSLFMLLVLVSGERRSVAEAKAARQNEQIAATGRLLAEARLRALQAQIEPHFLYNTLANVVGLIDSQPALARRMLERFIDYLRASLAASRAEQSTLGAEADLIAAYLDVLSVRMGARLHYRIEIGAELRQQALAPMLLQTLVENAITHGLEPKLEGGSIVISAHCDGARLCVQVADSGAGLTAPPQQRAGGGVGLANLRARLASLYGEGAQVQLLENQPCGMTARLLLPVSNQS